ncbi:60s ribosome biogenesis protein mak11 [Coemansia erecta]|uniref:60s ribosome biogenesis protein mak11 n=1 Tax=Coemansia asiatica TaxID=1052880 RepID=A0A9W8CL32_9FUNG|nr:60s ribosome biogenesis protein mak11 [Coemansia asiatica]KAJ2856441.1 60s ribosome biogenesis protein mak11 [Coemansia erecta]
MAGGQKKRARAAEEAQASQKSQKTTKARPETSKEAKSKTDKPKDKQEMTDSKASKGVEIPSLVTRQPAKDSFLVTAGTYERLLYGIEGRFVDDTLTLKAQFIFPAHIGCIKAVSVGGRYLASGSTDECIKLYDLKKRVELGTLHEHKGTITSLFFHGRTHMLSASEDGAICIFRTKDWEPLKVLRGHKGPITSIAVHPSGKLALSVSQDRTIIIWNLLTGQRASRTKTPQIGEMVAWSPSGNAYAVGYSTEFQLYKIGQAEAVATAFSKQRIQVMTIVEHKGKDYVLVGCQDKRVYIYSSEGTELGSVLCHENRIKGISSVDMTFPDEKVHTIVVTISSDGRVKAWRLDDLIESVLKTPSDNKTTDASDSQQPEALATYNADVRLTCVVASNNIFI